MASNILSKLSTAKQNILTELHETVNQLEVKMIDSFKIALIDREALHQS
jgi:hypothetical protein